MNKVKKITSRLYLMYGIALLPLIIFGLYKNGFELYRREYVDFLGALKPLILIAMSLVGTVMGIFLKHIIKNKKFSMSYLEMAKGAIIESILLGALLPIKAAPIVVFVVTLSFRLFLDNTKLNKVAIMYLIIALINYLLGLNVFENAYQASTTLNYNGLDLFLGYGTGGICSTNVFLIGCALAYLSFNKLYKKDLVISAIVTYLFLGIMPNVISGEYAGIFAQLFGYNVLFSFVFVAPNLYSSSYTTKGQILSGIVMGILTYFIILLLPYSGVMVSILLVNLLTGIFDRIFVIK